MYEKKKEKEEEEICLLLRGRNGGSLNGHSASRSIRRRSFAAQLIPESSNSSWPVRLSPRYCQSKDTSFLFFFSFFLLLLSGSNGKNYLNSLLSRGTARQDPTTSRRMPGKWETCVLWWHRISLLLVCFELDLWLQDPGRLSLFIKTLIWQNTPQFGRPPFARREKKKKGG